MVHMYQYQKLLNFLLFVLSASYGGGAVGITWNGSEYQNLAENEHVTFDHNEISNNQTFSISSPTILLNNLTNTGNISFNDELFNPSDKPVVIRNTGTLLVKDWGILALGSGTTLENSGEGKLFLSGMIRGDSIIFRSFGDATLRTDARRLMQTQNNGADGGVAWWNGLQNAIVNEKDGRSVTFAEDKSRINLETTASFAVSEENNLSEYKSWRVGGKNSTAENQYLSKEVRVLPTGSLSVHDLNITDSRDISAGYDAPIAAISLAGVVNPSGELRTSGMMVEKDKTLSTVAATETELAGRLVIYGDQNIVNGVLNNAGELVLSDSSSLSLLKGSTLTNTGTLNIAPEATLQLDKSANIVMSGGGSLNFNNDGSSDDSNDNDSRSNLIINASVLKQDATGQEGMLWWDTLKDSIISQANRIALTTNSDFDVNATTGNHIFNPDAGGINVGGWNIGGQSKATGEEGRRYQLRNINVGTLGSLYLSHTEVAAPSGSSLYRSRYLNNDGTLILDQDNTIHFGVHDILLNNHYLIVQGKNNTIDNGLVTMGVTDIVNGGELKIAAVHDSGALLRTTKTFNVSDGATLVLNRDISLENIYWPKEGRDGKLFLSGTLDRGQNLASLDDDSIQFNPLRYGGATIRTDIEKLAQSDIKFDENYFFSPESWADGSALWWDAIQEAVTDNVDGQNITFAQDKSRVNLETTSAFAAGSDAEHNITGFRSWRVAGQNSTAAGKNLGAITEVLHTGSLFVQDFSLTNDKSIHNSLGGTLVFRGQINLDNVVTHPENWNIQDNSQTLFDHATLSTDITTAEDASILTQAILPLQGKNTSTLQTNKAIAAGDLALGFNTWNILGNGSTSATALANELTYIKRGTLVLRGNTIGKGNTVVAKDATLHASLDPASNSSLAIYHTPFPTHQNAGGLTIEKEGRLLIDVLDKNIYSRLHYGKDISLQEGSQLMIDAQNYSDGAATLTDVLRAEGQLKGTFSTVDDNSLLFSFIPRYRFHSMDLSVTPDVQISQIIKGQKNTSALQPLAIVWDKIIRQESTGELSKPLYAINDDVRLTKAIAETQPLLGGSAQRLVRDGVDQLWYTVNHHTRQCQDTARGWVNLIGTKGYHRADSGLTGYDTQHNGIAMGTDFCPNNRSVIGVGFAYIDSHADSNTAINQSAKAKNWQFGLYGSKNIDMTNRIDFNLGWGRAFVEGNRYIGVVQRRAESDYQANIFRAGVGYSHHQVLDDLLLDPYFRLDYTRIASDSYTEKGAGAFNLSLNKQTTHYLTTTAGLKAKIPVNDVLSLQTNLAIGYDVHRKGEYAQAAFSGAPEHVFQVKNQRLGKLSGEASIGLNYQLDSSYLGVGMYGQIRRGSRNVSAQFNWGMRY